MNNILYQDHIVKNKDWLLGVLHIYNAAIAALQEVTMNTVCWDILQKINGRHAELTAYQVSNDYKNGTLDAAHYFVTFFSPNNGQISSIKNKLLEMLDSDVEQITILIGSITSEQNTSSLSSSLSQVKTLTGSPSLS